MFKYISFALIMALASIHIRAQDKIVITGGFGIPEFIHIAGHYSIDQFQIGIGLGGFPSNETSDLTSFIQAKYNLFGKNKYSDTKTFFVKSGVNYWRLSDNYKVDNLFFWNTKLGKDFYLDRQIGISIDLGIAYNFYKNTYYKKPQNSQGFDINIDLIPSGSFTIFYKL